jgi:hypothetical protein
MKELTPRQCAIGMVERYQKENPADVARDYRSQYYGTGNRNYHYWNAVIEEIEMIQLKIKRRN